jgi:predicted DNA-binding transcriptional regulator AlpA
MESSMSSDHEPECETYTLPEFFKIMGISKPVGYDLAKRNELPVPVIRVGEYRSVVSKRAVEELLNRPPVKSADRPSDADVWQAFQRVNAVLSHLMERIAVIEHERGLASDTEEDMLDVLAEARSEIRAHMRRADA